MSTKIELVCPVCGSGKIIPLTTGGVEWSYLSAGSYAKCVDCNYEWKLKWEHLIKW
jgi:hypothetical protein